MVLEMTPFFTGAVQHFLSMIERVAGKGIWRVFQKGAPVVAATWKTLSAAGLHVEPITNKAPFTDVPLAAFLEQERKWNVERRAWLCSLSVQLRRRAPRGFFQKRVMTHAWGPESGMMRVCLLRAQWKSLFHSSSFPHVSVFHPRHCRRCRRLAAWAPTVLLPLRVTEVIGYQHSEHISSVW